MTDAREYHQETKSGDTLAFYFCGWEKCKPGYTFGPAVRPHYLFHLVLSGCGFYERAGKRHELAAGEGFLILPGESTCYGASQTNPWEYCWIGFGGRDAERILQECGLGEENPVYEDRSGGMLQREMMRLVDSFTHSDINEYMLLGRLYLSLSYMVSKAPVRRTAILDHISCSLEFIHNNYGYDIGVAEIARHVGIDRTYLYRLFQQQMGQSPKTYLTDFRLRTAAVMLRETSLSVTEIALSCGFKDASLFDRHFREAYHCTPRQYRLDV